MLGTTTDISRTGVRVVFPNFDALPMLQIGQMACILIDLPENPYFTPRQLECKGRVVRMAEKEFIGPTAAFQILQTRVRERDGLQVDGDPAARLLP